MTKLGRLVKEGKIKSMEEIYLHSLPIKEYQIVDFFLPKLKDEVMKVCFSDLENSASSRFGCDVQVADEIFGIDQACPKANSCRSTYSIQGYRCYW